VLDQREAHLREKQPCEEDEGFLALGLVGFLLRLLRHRVPAVMPGGVGTMRCEKILSSEGPFSVINVCPCMLEKGHKGRHKNIFLDVLRQRRKEDRMVVRR
jgi:hypothetical protein